MEEKGKHLIAFETFYGMGIKRKLITLSNELDVPVDTLKKWAKNFNWNARIDKRDKEVFLKMKEQNDLESEKAIIYYQKGIRKIIRRDFLDPLAKGEELPFQIKSVKDLDILIKADVLLGGGVTSRTESVTKEAKKENEVRVIELIQNDEETWERLNEQYLEGEVNECGNGDS